MGLQYGWTLPGLPPKPCDACKSSPAAVFCRADSAYLCLTCDSKIHCANKLASRHQRLWMCEVCEQAPAAFTCKADAAALCVTCDADVHSANPLAGRHERVPVEPFFDSAVSIVKSTAALNNNGLNDPVLNGVVSSVKNDVDDLLIPNLNFSSKPDMFFPEMESLFEFDYPNPIQSSSTGLDSVVPVQPDSIIPPPPVLNQPSHETCFNIDFCRNKLSSSFTYPGQSLSHSVSSSSLDVGVVPDSLSDISYPFIRNVNQNSLESSVIAVPAPVTASQASQLSAVDRELRVMRYREKRKNRKFQKTIRYASRKAYAETRPRIKGRFAKRTESETEVMDRIFNSAPGSYITDASQYGVVPTF